MNPACLLGGHAAGVAYLKLAEFVDRRSPSAPSPMGWIRVLHEAAAWQVSAGEFKFGNNGLTSESHRGPLRRNELIGWEQREEQSVERVRPWIVSARPLAPKRAAA